jgi:hypothetical protein
MSAVLAFVTGRASAEPWSIEPRLGATAGYDSNPALTEPNPVSEEHVAALFTLPLRYDADGVEFLLSTSGRISNSPGFSSLASNYFHLDSSLLLTDELDSTTVQGELSRDSSLYHVGGLVNGVGVRRDIGSAAGDWTRYLTELTQLQLDASWSRVNYDQPPGETSLVDYKYWNAGPTFAFTTSELNTFKILSSFGQYQSQNGLTESKSVNAQLGFVRQLNALWSLSLTGGYSHSTNSEKYYFGPYYLGTISTAQNGGVYQLNLVRKGEQFTFSGSVSQSLQPTGFAYLTLQESVNLTATYIKSERWDFSLGLAGQKLHIPYPNGEQNVKYLFAELTANWHWTEQWIISLHAIHVNQEFGAPPENAASSGVGVDIVRQFLRHDL